MASDLRSSGRAGVRLHPGDHVCAFVFGSRQRNELLLPSVRAGLRAGERCVCVVPPSEERSLLDTFRRRTVAAGSGELVLPSSESAAQSLTWLGAMPVMGLDVDAATSTPGHRPADVRLISDLAWVEQQRRRPGALAAYERDLERLVTHPGHLALCFWDLEQSDVATIPDLLMTHPKLLLGPHLIDSPWYVAGSDRAAARQKGRGRVEGLLGLATLMMAANDPRTISALAAIALRSIGSVQLDGIFVRGQGWLTTNGFVRDPQVRTSVEARLIELGPTGGSLAAPGGRWSWAYPLDGPDAGFLLTGTDHQPAARDRFLVRLVAQKVGLALANVRLHERHRIISRELHHAREALSDATAMLDWNTAVRERLGQVVASGGGPNDIAFAIHDITGHTVVVEDPDGAIRAWAGPDEPLPCGRSTTQRKKLLARALHARRPIWDNDRLVAVATRNNDVVGLVSFVDPVDQIGEGEVLAIEDGATLLALELHHQRELAQTEARLGRNLLSELLEGTDDHAVLDRAAALGYDFDRSRRVVLVDPSEPADPELFFHAVWRAARDTGFGAFLVPRGSGVVVLTDAGPPWERLSTAVVSESGGGACRLGIGKSCDQVSDLPSSLRQATLALKLQDIFGAADNAVEFEQLGIYRLLADVADTSDVEPYIRSWLHPLEPLMDYDAVNHSELVATLSTFLECGGRHLVAAKALNVHRRTLKYRIQRIKEISGCDLTDPDTLFNLQLSTRAWQTLAGLRP